MKTMKRNRTVGIMLLALMLAATFAMFPSAFAGDWLEGRYDTWGPRVDQIRINMYSGPSAEFTALAAHDIDITDWPLTKDWVDAMAPDPLITQDWYGGERGMFNIDINQNETLPDGSYNPFGDQTIVTMTIGAGPDTGLTYTAKRGYHLAHAVAHLLKRSDFVTTVLEGLGEECYSWMPTFYGDNRLGSQMSIDYGYSPPDEHPYSPTEAADILDQAGFVDTDADTWRNDPVTGNNLNIDFVYRYQHTPGRKEMGEWTALEMEAVGIDVTLDPKSGGGAFQKVMVEKNFMLYTGGWNLGTVPDHMYGLFHNDMYWDQNMFCLNYGHHNDADHNYLSELVYYAPDPTTAMIANWQVQETWVDPEHIGSSFSFWTAMAPKASLIPIVDPAHAGETWANLVNELGFGINTYLTFINMHPSATTSGGKVEYGMYVSEFPGDLNVFYASWYPDYEVIGKVYDSLLLSDPYNPTVLDDYNGWLAYNWEVGTWANPDNPDFPTSTKVTFYLRDDVTWHDGTPFTSADVEFTIAYALASADVDWYPSVADIHHTTVIDAYTIEIYENVLSCWAVNWLGVGFPIAPEHIWAPIIATGDPYAFSPDPQLIGTGPFKVYPHSIDPLAADYYVPGAYCLLDANTNFYLYNSIEQFVPYETAAGTDMQSYIGVVNRRSIPQTVTVTLEYESSPSVWTTLGAKAVTVGANGKKGIDFETECAAAGLLGDYTVHLRASTTAPARGVTLTRDRTTHVTRPGDINSDNSVGIKDAVLLSTSYAKPTPWFLPADIDLDGSVGLTDAIKLSTHYGMTSP